MTRYSYDILPGPRARLGLVVLQPDETLEGDFRRLIPADVRWLVSRVPSAPDVSRDSLEAIGAHLPAAAALLPATGSFDVLGYGCTSGSAQLGADRIAELLRQGAEARATTNPMSALLAACAALGLRRLAILSPYVAPVSARLREVLAEAGVDTPVFGSFEEPSEKAVTAIDPRSVALAARDLVGQGGVDGLFLSCTNLRTLEVIPELEADLGLPVLSSNLVLAWDMLRLAGIEVTHPSALLT